MSAKCVLDNCQDKDTISFALSEYFYFFFIFMQSCYRGTSLEVLSETQLHWHRPVARNIICILEVLKYEFKKQISFQILPCQSAR